MRLSHPRGQSIAKVAVADGADVDVAAAAARRAFGGYKQFGWGRETGHQAIELYTATKSAFASL